MANSFFASFITNNLYLCVLMCKNFLLIFNSLIYVLINDDEVIVFSCRHLGLGVLHRLLHRFR